MWLIVSSFASKTNLAALKTEADKIDTDKSKTAPADLAKLTNAIENDLVKKTVYNTKVTSIETQIPGLTKNTVDNLANITKIKAIDTNSFVTRTKFSADTNAFDDKIDSESEKTGLYGSIYDFVVDYEQIVGVKTIYEMHRYLMTKHNIKP